MHVLRPDPRPELGRGVALAVLAHLGLVVALKAGLAWRSHAEPALEAELWSAIPEAAAPRAEEPEPVTPPPPPPQQAKPQPLPTEALPDAAIALEREKKKREQAERERLERLERERREAEKLKREKAEAEQRRKDELARAERDKAKAQEQEKAREREAQRRAEVQRQENLRRIQGMAGASGGPQATGTALQSSGPASNYAGRIKARVRPNIVFGETVAGNPVAEVEVRCAPDGLILSARLAKGSGHPGWDQAVLRAVEKTERLPRNENGQVPSSLILSFKPNE
ncbi:cell envelope integrity protein TolA [Inhella gelatinilytica]|uniref:cell envelope integrity protein TolA n=1 Tax=Inhella gelatinilytica TaxID=2795030 RepID=UPI002873492A|nr:cell envelope integrity protein TolA [Inhella gelatinilytica]